MQGEARESVFATKDGGGGAWQTSPHHFACIHPNLLCAEDVSTTATRFRGFHAPSPYRAKVPIRTSENREGIPALPSPGAGHDGGAQAKWKLFVLFVEKGEGGGGVLFDAVKRARYSAPACRRLSNLVCVSHP